MYAILKTRIEYDPYGSYTSKRDYHDILPEVFGRMKDAIAYINRQIAEDEVTRPYYAAKPLEGDELPFIYEVEKHKIKMKDNRRAYLAIHSTYENTSHHLYRWLEYEVFPVVKRRHSHDA